MQKTLSLFLFILIPIVGFSQAENGNIADYAPVASNVSAATVKNTNATIHLVASDADFDSLTYIIVTSPSNGTATLNGDTVTYTPTTDFSGTDTFTFKVNDGSANSATKTVTVKVIDGYKATATQIGSDLDVETDDLQGYSVSFNEDHTIMVVGAPEHYGGKGTVRVYSWNGTAWSRQGSDLDGEGQGQQGSSVSLSSDGTILAVGADRHDSGKGTVRVYSYNGTAWFRQGSDLDGEAGDNQGRSVSLSSDGTTLAVGAPGHDSSFGYGNGEGTVRVYTYDGATWNRQGSDLDGEPNDNAFSNNPDAQGKSVSLSSDGTILAVGAYGHDSAYKGTVRVYRYNGTVWSQEGSDLDGEAYDYQGISVSLSSDGTTLAVGAPGHDSSKGTVRVYNLVNNVPDANESPVANSQNLETKVDVPLAIKLTASDLENDPLTYVIQTLPENGQLTEGGKVILQSELPKVILADDISYVSSTLGEDSFTFLVKQNSLATFAKNNSLRFITQDDVPVTYTKPKGKTYFLIQNAVTKMDWPEAKALTDTFKGAQMFVPLNKSMDQSIYDALKSMNRLDGPFWYGLYQDKTASDWKDSLEPGGGWVWVDGVKLGSTERPYTNWHSGEPNNGDNREDYAQFNRFTGGFTWNDMKTGAGRSYAVFEFSVNNVSDSNIATITIQVQDLSPVADSQTVTFSEGSINNAITLTGSDPQSKPLTYILNTIPEKGTLKVGGLALGDLPLTVAPSDLTYDPPNENYFGEQSFKFKVNNGENDSAAATVSIEIDPVNDLPESDPGNYSTKEDVPIDIIHVGRDKDLIDVFTTHTQMGTTLPQPSEQLGESLALSANGKRLILGAYSTGAFARVYDWNGTDWEQLGETLNGETNGDWFGEYVSISNDGNRIAVAGSLNDNANGTDAGHIKVFDWNGTSWDIVGSPILGNNAGDTLGYRGVHLSGDGRTLATISFSGGYVVTYAWDGSAWNKIGALIDIVKSPGNPGSPGQVYLSTDGKRLAVGSVADGSKGNVRVFDWDGSSWIQFASIDGKSGNFGCAIDLSRDGKKLIVGEKNTSLTSVYDISGASPVQIGADINYSGNQSSVFWRYVSISDDGNRVGIPVMSSKLGVFDWDGTLWNQLGKDVTGGFGESFDMSSDAKIMAAGIHSGPNKVFNILNLEYIITTLPSNGTLKEGAKTLVAADLPYTLTTSDQKLTYTPNNNYYGTDSYLFKLNDGKADSTNSLNGNREDSKVTITIEEFTLTLPSNYKTSTIESCEGSDVGILNIEVAATTFRKTGTTVDIPITYNVAIVGKGNVGTIVSPNKILQVKDLAKGTYELKFTIDGEPKYVHPKVEFTIDEIATPTVYDVGKIEVCDDAVDGDDLNGKAKFDTSTIINGLLKDPNTGVAQDANLLDIEFTYFDQATNASVSAATLPNPFYSASQTVTVKLTSKANTSCIGLGAVVFVVNTLPVFERIDDTKFVCLNLDAVTIGVKSSDSRTYSYTWTRNGTAFNLNIPGFDSTILIGLGGDYEVTATTTDGTSCSQVLKFNIGESDIATVLKKDIIIADLNPGPNNTITVLTETLGIGDYEFAIDDVSGPYQDEPTFENVRPGLHTIYIRDKNECGVVNIKSIVIGYKKFFTPNGDGIHDTWNIIGLTKTSLPNSKIYIFDRFGKLLKQLDPLSPGWDGTFIGKPMPSTDYWFRVQLEDGREFKSHFSLVRDWN